jgi:RHS repeat-associated protein
LEATVREADDQTTAVVADYFGNTLATATTANQVNWTGMRFGGFGPVQGYQPPVLSPSTTLAEATLWRGRRIDPTGYYWFGARYYEPTSGRWLSADPLGHDASWGLYGYAGNDPVNGLDPDGRLGKGFAAGVESRWNRLISNADVYQGDPDAESLEQVQGSTAYNWGHFLGYYSPEIASVLLPELIGGEAEAGAMVSRAISFERNVAGEVETTSGIKGASALAKAFKVETETAEVSSAAEVAGNIEMAAAEAAETENATAGLPGNAENLKEAGGAKFGDVEALPSGIGGTGSAYDKLAGQGLYVLRDDAGVVKYVGRGDAPARIALHANAPGKDMLSGLILWENNLTKAQAKGLEQRLIDQFGGALSQNPSSPLLNQFRSFAPENPSANIYRNAASGGLWIETLRRLGL